MDSEIVEATGKLEIHEFYSFEEQLSYFVNESKTSLIPTIPGARIFLGELGNWLVNYNDELTEDWVSVILPNPSQGMSFPTPFDVLSTILQLQFDSSSLNDQVHNHLLEFGLDESMATRPVVSLSGGELLLLNYAKTKAMLPVVKGLFACSPLRWLNPKRFEMWEHLVSAMHHKNKFIDVSLLLGEPFIDYEYDAAAIFEKKATIPAKKWELVLNDPKVTFQETSFPTYQEESCIEFECSASTMDLMSPSLVIGDNGIGKSVLAKVLSGIITPSEGDAYSVSQNGKGLARVLFQDSIEQLFGKTVDAHSQWVFRFDSWISKKAESIYQSMESAIRNDLHSFHFKGISSLGTADKKSSLLQAKLRLVAERISTSPPLLILDEPGWGLSKIVAQCFMHEACKHAHEHGVAVAIITHQPDWWADISRSIIRLSDLGKGRVGVSQGLMNQ